MNREWKGTCFISLLSLFLLQTLLEVYKTHLLKEKNIIHLIGSNLEPFASQDLLVLEHFVSGLLLQGADGRAGSQEGDRGEEAQGALSWEWKRIDRFGRDATSKDDFVGPKLYMYVYIFVSVRQLAERCSLLGELLGTYLVHGSEGNRDTLGGYNASHTNTRNRHTNYLTHTGVIPKYHVGVLGG